MLYMVVIGFGMGNTMPLFVIAVQNSVAHGHMGVATSSVQFFRSVGGTIGVTVLGALLASSLDAQIRQQAPGALSALTSGARGLGEAQSLLDPAAISQVPPFVLSFLRTALSNSLHEIFLATLVTMAAAFAATLFLREVPLKKTIDRGPLPQERTDLNRSELSAISAPLDPPEG